tara:strand:+ start:216 stop:965 length:750 start_codon:yes stop_codon:yes gene_type:complete
MKKNIYYLLAHQDDEFGIFIDISSKIKNNNIHVFYLTSGYKKNISKLKLSIRDKESINVLKKIGVREKNIHFLGKQLDIRCNNLFLNMRIVYLKLLQHVKGSVPQELVTLAWEGGHEDHDACNLITRKIAMKLRILNCCREFSLYNAYDCKYLYFRVFNPLKKGTIIKTNFLKRLYYIMLLFSYRSQFKIWFGLYPFIIYHYLFYGYNYMQQLNQSKNIIKPHNGKLLYELRNFCDFKNFKSKTKSFLK